MSGYQNKLSRFWQELKRRRVIHVIAVYASAAFVIIELAGNLTEPLNLPASFSTIVIIFLAIGFPLAVILSWLYDLTSGTFERTRPMEDIPEEGKSRVPNAWKIATYVSFIVIIGLATLNIVSRGDILKPGMIQSLVVLPFNNYTGDEDLEYFVSGMHSSLIGDMGKVSGLRILSETTSKIYNNAEKSVPEIASELKVDAVVEPTLTCFGDSICLQVKVFSAFPEEKLLWMSEYKEDRRNILSLYNRITKQIAKEVQVELTPEEDRLLSKSQMVDRETYEAYLKSYQVLGDLSESSLRKGLEYLETAIEKDPDWAPLYTGMARAWGGLQQAGHEPPDIAGPKINEYLSKALELDPDIAEVHDRLAVIAWVSEWNWDKAEKEFLHTLAINPNNSLMRMWYAHLLYQLQRHDEAIMQARLARDLDPLNPFIQSAFAVCLLCDGDCEEAMSVLDNVLASDQGNTLANNILEKAAFRCGDNEKVYKAAKYHIPLSEETYEKIDNIFEDKGFISAYEEILRQLEVKLLSDFIINPVTIASKYHMVGQDDKAMDWIEKGFELGDPNMPYIGTGYYNMFHLYDNPRFIGVLEKMKLPAPVTN